MKTIYATTDFDTSAVTDFGNMFYDCPNLVGGAGTTYSSSNVTHTYAHIDGGTSNPGYFTDWAHRDITVAVGDTDTIELGGHASGYTITTAPDSSIATCTVNGKNLQIQGISTGTTTVVITPIGTNRTITVNITVNDYKINYQLNLGTTTNPNSYSTTTPTFTLSNPSRKNYTFLGWAGDNDINCGLENYTVSNPAVCNQRDNVLGNAFNVVPGENYRIFIKAKLNSGFRWIRGGLWYTKQSTGNSWDGYFDFSLGEELQDDWMLLYKDVTIPSGKEQAKLFIQFEMSASAPDTSYIVADCHIVKKDNPVTIAQGSSGDKSFIAYWTLGNETNYFINYGTVHYTNTLAEAVDVANQNATISRIALGSGNDDSSPIVTKDLELYMSGSINKSSGSIVINSGSLRVFGESSCNATIGGSLFKLNGGTLTLETSGTISSNHKIVEATGRLSGG